MRVGVFAAVILLIWIVAGCTVAPSPLLPTELTATPMSFPKQPEPSRPRIEGEISGVQSGTLVTIHVRTPSGWEARTVRGPFPGRWESVVTDASGADYIVTAEAEGYVSQPISYTIRLSGDTAYVVRDGQVTNEEAVRLDFHFVSTK